MYQPLSHRRIVLWLLVILWLGLGACEQEEPVDPHQLLAKVMTAHGGEAYDQQRISFRFRDKGYSATLQGTAFSYSRTLRDSTGEVITDMLTPTGFSRYRLGEKVEVPDTMATKYAESVNSVWYFALLPKPLQDPAVMLKSLGTSTVGENRYHKLEVRFAEEGGGTDFQDVYVYWIHPETYHIDYLAYSFVVNGGGLRFRKAYNRREVGGITFQDYVNYKADPAAWEVQHLDRAFDQDGLEELSRIALESIKVAPINLE